jgi:predicted O-methyltransferase YrrM
VETISLYNLIDKWQHKINKRMPVELMMTTYERKCLAALACEYDHGLDILEFGTWQGLTAYYLAKVFPNKLIWTIDLPKELAKKDQINKHQPDENPTFKELGVLYKMGCCINVQQIISDSIELDPHKYILNKLDFCFIDGNHSYPYTKNDAEKAISLLCSGGILALHNFIPNYKPDPQNLSVSSADGPNYFVQTNPQYNWKYIQDTCVVYCEIK